MKKPVIRSLKVGFTFLTLLAALAQNARAVDATVDSTFAIGSGAGYPDPGAVNWGQVQAVAVQPDGRVIAGGQALFDDFNGAPVPALCRINVDGSLDTAFVANLGTGPLDVTAPEVNSIVIQPDGKILIGGPFTTVNGVNRRGIARLNEDGTLDTGFIAAGGGVGGAVVRYVYDVALQTDGKVLIAGGFTTYLGTARPGVARLNSDGTLDTSFNPGFPAGMGTTQVAQSIGVDASGKVFVGGTFTNWLGLPTPGIVRLQANGDLDTSFIPTHTAPFPSIGVLRPLGDGRVLLGGFVEGVTNTTRYIVRLNSDGSLDPSYPVDAPNGWVSDIVDWPGGGHLIMGRFRDVGAQPRGELALLDDAGNVDLSFAPPRVLAATNDLTHVYRAAVAPDGKIVIGGWFTNYPAQTNLLNGQNYSGLARLIGGYTAGPGTIQFKQAGLLVNEAAGTATLSVTRFGGSVGAVGVTYASFAANATAGVDYTSVSNTLSWAAGELGTKSFTVPIASDTEAEPLESFVVLLSAPTGGATLGIYSNAAVVIVDDDSVPTILAPPQDTSVLLTFPTAMHVVVGPGLPVTYQWLSNGVPIVGANSAILNFINAQTNFAANYSVIVSNSIGAVTSSVATLTIVIPAGLPDPSFIPTGTGFNGDVGKFVFGPDGSIIVGGSFSQLNGFSISTYIAKLHADGSRDATFPPAGTGANNVLQTIAAYPDGRLFIGGNFTQFTGTNRNRAARLLASGALDLTFTNSGVSSSFAIYAVLPQADGSAFLGDSSFVRKFNNLGTNDTNWAQTPLIGQVYAMAQQADGKIIAAPYRSSFPSGAELIRLNTNGTRDFTFANPGRLAGGSIQTVKMLPDGRIFVGGGFTSLVANESTNSLLYAAVFNSDGTLDTTFNPGTGPNGTIIESFVQPDGRILVGGGFTTWNGVAVNGYARILPNGQVDSTFVIGSGINSGFVRAIGMDAAGRIAIGGSFTSVNGQSRGRLALLTMDGGAVQFTAATRQVNEQGGPVTVSVERVAGSRGELAVNYATANGTAGAGDFTAASGLLTWTNGEYGVKTFDITLNNDSDMENDETFSVGLSGITGGVAGLFTNLTVQILDNESAPRLLTHPTNIVSAENLTVTFTASAQSALPLTYQWRSNNVNLLNATNASLTLTNVQTNFAATYFLRVSNTVGFIDSSNAVLTIIPSPTRLDTTFTVSPAFNGGVQAIYPLGDGRVLVGGSFTQPRTRLALLNSNGVVDASFTNTATAVGGFTTIYDIERDSKGRWLIGGSFGAVGGISFSNITRLNPDYTVDTNFLAALWMPPNGAVYDVAVGSNGKIWVAGGFSSIGGPYGLSSLVRLNENGSLDLSFRARPNNNNAVQRVIPLADGGAYVGGVFTGWDGISVGSLVKIFADGSRDASFNPNAGNAGIYDLALLPDGTLFAAGNTDPRIYKFRPNGSRDTSYLDGVAVNSGVVNSIAVQPNGRLVAGGAFTSFGIHTNRFTRVNADGTQDTSLSLGTGFGGDVSKVALEQGGAIWVGGAFTTYKGTTPAYLARLIGDESTVAIGKQPLDGVAAPTQNFTFSASAAGTGTLSYQWLKNGSPISNGGVVSGANTASLTLTGVSTNDAGNYSLIVSNSAGAFATSRAASLQVISVPVITSQPMGGFVPAGGRIFLSVGAESPGTPNYFWSKDGAPIGANSPLYILTNSPTTAGGNYQVVVSNSFGSVTSSIAAVTVEITPATAAPGFFTDAGTVNASDTIYALQPMPDGQLLVGGTFAQIKTNGANNTSRSGLALFTTNGGVAAFNPGSSGVTDVVRQRDGKILVSGGFTSIGGEGNRRYLARFNADLTFDTNFHLALYRSFSTNGPDQSVNDIALQADGKILIAGGFTSVMGLPNTRGIARLNTDGSVDSSFVSGAANFSSVSSVEVLPDGRVILVSSGSYGGHSASVYRLSASGAVDVTFTNSVSGVTALALHTNGAILIGGTFTTVHGYNRPLLARLMSNGALDTNFLAGVTNVTANNQAVIYTIAVQENGKILAGGNFYTFGPFRNGLARFNADGTPDSSFLFQQGVGDDMNASIRKIALFADGRIAIGGRFKPWEGTTENGLAILNGDPIPLNFASQPVDQFVPANTTSYFSAVAVGTPAISYQWYRGLSVLTDGGNISGATTATLTVSNATTAEEGMYSLLITNAAGGMRFSQPAELYILEAPEIRTQPVGGTYYVSNMVTLQATVLGAAALKYEWLFNSNVIAGATNSFLTFTNLALTNAGDYQLVASNALGMATSSVATLNVLLPPAALSPTWPHPAGANQNIYALQPLGDGRIIIGGQYSFAGTNGNQTASANLTLLNTNGTVDTSFNPAPNGQVEVVRRDANGKFLVGGQFNNIGGQARSYLARLNSDGSLDINFLANLGTGPNNPVYDIALQTDGKILVAGYFTLVSGQSYPGIVRLNVNGSIDTSFRMNASFPQIYSLSLRTDGKIYAGGFVTISNRQNIVRLETNGAVDLGFMATANSSISKVLATSDGGVLLGGFYNVSINGSASINGLAKLNADGSLNNAWPQTRPDGTVEDMIFQTDGKLIVAGQFFTIGIARQRVARYNSDGTLDTTFAPGSGFNQNAYAVTLESDGRIWVGGGFTTYNGNAVNRLILLVGDAVAPGSGSPFENWAESAGLTPGNDAPDQDPDNDGVDNVFEFYLGTSPTNSASANEPVATSVSSGGQTYPAITFIRVKDISGVTLLPQASSDVDFTNSLGTVVESILDLGDGTELVTIRSAVSAASQPAQFLRIQLSIP